MDTVIIAVEVITHREGKDDIVTHEKLSLGAELGSRLMKYRVYLSATADLTADVDDKGLDQQEIEEKAIELALEEAPKDVCARVMGAHRNASRGARSGYYQLKKEVHIEST